MTFIKFSHIIIFFTFWNSCLNKSDKVNFPAAEGNQWLQFADSIITLHFEAAAADSISIYYMNENAPAVLGEAHFIIWKGNTPIKNHRFFDQISDFEVVKPTHFIFLTYSNGQIYLQEIKVGSDISYSDQTQFKLSRSSCQEIQYANIVSVDNNSVNYKIRVEDICFNHSSDTLVTYMLKL